MSRGNEVGMIWKNFVNSLKPRQRTGNLMGEDYFGNKYFEIPANPQIGKRKPERWFEPAGYNMDKHFDRELTAEIRLKYKISCAIICYNIFRVNPPTDEELKRNLAIMQMKKINAAELEEKYSDGKEKDSQLEITTGAPDFPKYKEYERVVGKRPEYTEDETVVTERPKMKNDDNKKLT